jgi:hypothetical protein
MTRRELFIHLMGKHLNNEGFNFVKRKRAFIKKENGNEFMYQYESDTLFLMVQIDFRILLKSVEHIKKEALGKLYDKFESVGINKMDMFPKDKFRDGLHDTETEEQVYIATEKEIIFYNSVVKEYFHKHSDISYIDKYLNENPNESKILTHYNQAHTCFLAIIVAYLVGNLKINELIEFYRKLVIKSNDQYLKKFDLIKEYILTH